MARRTLSRETLLPVLAGHVLAHGIQGASLRPLARAAGTSDRMLLYHFGTKQALIEALLDHLSAQFAAVLGAAAAGPPVASRGECFRRVAQATRTPAFAPFMQLWWQIVAGTASGDTSFKPSAARIVEAMLAWIESQLPPDDPDRHCGAQAILAAIEGLHMLDAVGASAVADAAVAGLFGD